jgi:chromosomal replication initiation ATPase DnaA
MPMPLAQFGTKQELSFIPGLALSLWRGEMGWPARSMASIAADVALRHGMSLEALRSPTRAHPVAHARQEAMAAMREIRAADGRRRYSYGQIARFFGFRRHTTVIHAVRACRRRTELAGGRP